MVMRKHFCVRYVCSLNNKTLIRFLHLHFKEVKALLDTNFAPKRSCL